MWQAAPQWAVVVVICAGFLFYLDRREQREVEREKRIDQVAELRIEQCHAVQASANEIMQELAEALKDQSRTMDRLQQTIETHDREFLRHLAPRQPMP